MDSLNESCWSGKSIWIEIFLYLVLAGLIASILILSWVPPVSKDALVHHLAVPKLYLKHGGVYEIPSMSFSYYPMNLDLLYIIPLYFGNDIAPKFIHFGFALLTAGLIFHYLQRKTNTVYALLGAIFFLSVPIIIKLSITVYVDLGVIFFSTASLLLLLKWVESRFRVQFLILSAILCGLAMGTKYNGLVTFFLLTLFVPFIASRYTKGKKPGFIRSAGYGIIFFFIALLFFSPWMVRNYNWKNNPIYPLYNQWFSPPHASPENITSGEGAKEVNQGIFTFRSIIYHETWWQIALLPLRVFFQGKDGNPQFFDGKLNPFLLFLPIFAFYRIREGPQVIRNEKKIMLAFVILFFGIAFFSSVLRMRYISPIIPPLVILSVFGLKNIIGIVRELHTNTTKRIGFGLVFLILTFFFTLNAYYVISQFRYVDPFNYLNGTLSRDDYMSKYRREYPVMQYVNRHLSFDAQILFVFLGKRGYYCDRKYVLGEGKLGRLVEKSNDPKEVLSELKGIGITNLLINYDIFQKWVKNNLTKEKQEVLKQFFEEYVRLLYYKDGFGVSALRNCFP
ncbi:MAG: phospholipid carrier-dependent glycosyltransferase [Deltaproteobacteria bacterium]|nr:phospholipid carrier-dependent glycosyltransferase [Deltaproteobacteria bacterium]